MYDNSVYPDCWAKSMLVPIPKNGDKRDVNNYRGISLSSIFSKVFSQVLDSRLLPYFLFCFINNMSTSLYDDTVKTISIDELQICLLLFADDTVLFSYTPQGL